MTLLPPAPPRPLQVWHRVCRLRLLLLRQPAPGIQPNPPARRTAATAAPLPELGPGARGAALEEAARDGASLTQGGPRVSREVRNADDHAEQPDGGHARAPARAAPG